MFSELKIILHGLTKFYQKLLITYIQSYDETNSKSDIETKILKTH